MKAVKDEIHQNKDLKKLCIKKILFDIFDFYI